MYFLRILNIIVKAHNFYNTLQLVACCFLHLFDHFVKTSTYLKMRALPSNINLLQMKQKSFIPKMCDLSFFSDASLIF